MQQPRRRETHNSNSLHNETFLQKKAKKAQSKRAEKSSNGKLKNLTAIISLAGFSLAVPAARSRCQVRIVNCMKPRNFVCDKINQNSRTEKIDIVSVAVLMRRDRGR